MTQTNTVSRLAAASIAMILWPAGSPCQQQGVEEIVWKLNDFKVYDVTAVPAAEESSMQGQFDADPQPATLDALTRVAVPVAVNGAEIKSPRECLTWYRLRPGSPQPIRFVEVENRFGRQRLTLGNVHAMLAPAVFTQPRQPGPSNKVQLQHGSHFKVYEVIKHQCIKPVGRTLSLRDQLGGELEVDVLLPRFFAVPTDLWQDGKVDRIENAIEHLTIYQFKSPPQPVGHVEVEDRFAAYSLDLVRSELLCVPSLKRWIPPPAALDAFQVRTVTQRTSEHTVGLKGWLDGRTKTASITRLTHLASPVALNDRELFDDQTELTWYRIDQLLPDPVRTIKIWNEFGEQELALGRPKYLLVPARSTKADREPPRRLDHFKCFVVLKSCCAPDNLVEVTDGEGKKSAVHINPPALFCVPVAKTHDGATTPLGNTRSHLTFYPVTRDDHAAVVRVTDQFGESELRVGPRVLLGLPTLALEVFPPVNGVPRKPSR